jgi:hypothetical protein
MKKGTVTGEVKRILKDLGIHYGITFSDKYGETKVGAKFCQVYLTDEQKQIVKERMEEQGFTFHFIRENQNSYSFWNGTRFCFTKNN